MIFYAQTKAMNKFEQTKYIHIAVSVDHYLIFFFFLQIIFTYLLHPLANSLSSILIGDQTIAKFLRAHGTVNADGFTIGGYLPSSIHICIRCFPGQFLYFV